jgi:hypothetical protein
MMSQGHLKKEGFGRRFNDIFSDIFQISGREVIYMGILVAILAFFSTFNYLGGESSQPQATEPNTKPWLPQHAVVIAYYGFPFESLKKNFTITTGIARSHGTAEPIASVEATLEIMWGGSLADLAIFTLISFAIVKVIVKINDEIHFRRYEAIDTEQSG